MCIQTTYHNTYSDGTVDQTERVETCSAGFLCLHPKPKKVYRSFDSTKAELDMQRRTSYYTEERRGRPATPRSISPPSSRGSDTERKHRRRSSIYPPDPIRTAPGSRPYVPQPPSPIPIKRSSTMAYGVASPPLRGRAPIIIADPAPRYTHASATIPIGPIEVLEHASPRRRDSRRDSSGVYLSPDLRRHSRSPQGYASAEDERERADRRRRRREAKTQAKMFSSSVPTPYINNGGYASSYGSSHTSSFVDPSPAATAVKKELRWEDDERAKQNARINSRPKRYHRDTLRMSPAQGEVKSILKNAGSTSTSPAGRARPSSRGEEIDELYRSLEGLGIDERETSAQRRARAEKERQDEAQKDRLRGRFDLPGPDRRFSMPPRSYTMGSGGRRRQEIWYPDQRTYRTQW